MPTLLILPPIRVGMCLSHYWSALGLFPSHTHIFKEWSCACAVLSHVIS